MDEKESPTTIQSVSILKDLCYDCAILVEEELMGANHVGGMLDLDIEWGTPSLKLLAITMAYYADKRGIVRLTLNELGENIVLSPRRVVSLRDELCDLGVIARLGHGRYGIRYGLKQKDSPTLVNVPKQKKGTTPSNVQADTPKEEFRRILRLLKVEREQRGEGAPPIHHIEADPRPGEFAYLVAYDPIAHPPCDICRESNPDIVAYWDRQEE